MRLTLPGRLRWWHLYLLVLGLSHLWQAVAPRDPVAGPRRPSLEVPRHDAAGTVDGPPVTIAYADVGEGDPVVYLHGSPGSGGDSRRLAGHLAGRHRVLAPDLPGFGGSSPWVPDYGIEAQARYVLAFLDALEIDRAHLVGHSLGSGVAYQVAHLRPERVASIVAYGGIGIQEVEGSGDYHLEHLKYATGYALLVVAPEVVPHFGLLGPRALRHGAMRSFWDTDQRPMRAVLESLEAPLLILHGRRDPLVTAAAARAHHRIVRHSELVMMEASHFMVFRPRGAARLAEEILPFLERHATPGAVPKRRTLDYTIGAAPPDPAPSRLTLSRGLGPWGQIGALAVATFVSEDLTCISAGLLARDGRVDFFVAILGCALGIYVGDVGLWLLGRAVGRRVLRWRWVAKRIPAAQVERFGTTFDRHIGKAIFASRFLPGARLPMYVGAGMVSKRPVAFMAWLFAASWVWTPILVMAALVFGPVAMRPFEAVLGVGWPSWVGAVVLLFLSLRVVVMSCSRHGRARLAAAVSRIWRWEFWPIWLFYLPVCAWIGRLAIRYRGLATPTATNPALPHGGFVGESKSEILERLPAARVQPSFRVDPGEKEERVAGLRAHARREAWSFPLILKPDQGQRGVGLKLVRGWEEVERYLGSEPRAVLAQTYHPGPLEAGIFYYRMPGEATGRIFSITDKRFPEVTGDGRSTLEDLILRDRRLRMQAGVFARRHAGRLGRVPGAGERVRLAVAGNHCQGTMFLDGSHLATPELERAVDEAARHRDGFFFGRFDVRYASVPALRRGEGFKIIELNGVTSESTNVYDPSCSLRAAWRTLGRQWSLAFRIGDANRKRGHPTSSWRELLRAARNHYGHRAAERIAD